MAISLNRKLLPQIVANAYASGLINDDSSSTVPLFLVSRYWREAFRTATRFKSRELPDWTEKEVAAGRLIVNAVLFLHMEACSDIEELIQSIIKSDSEHEQLT